MKYRMVRSNNTNIQPLKSAMKAVSISNMSENTSSQGNGRNPSFLPVPSLCNVSSLSQCQPAHTVPAPLTGWGSTGQHRHRNRVTFNPIIESYSVEGDLYLNKVTLYSPGTHSTKQFFRSKTAKHLRLRRAHKPPAATPETTCSIFKTPAEPETAPAAPGTAEHNGTNVEGRQSSLSPGPWHN